ncbi:malonyl-ACP O-methyltransferase BioC [Thiopseudomonas denitrificans]|uniref:Malonyl-[acyl-carrier protein] O-methyltransferase n=1 Tax=Thiopseudomonas denitrificans TaxID=1501432 RepID=A0A4R6TYE7_9GAMM|nr:malonyl-ACP O-methyltransferase BioC [Thiopseudomonas denitrificans]TDQ37862.1 pimeloyl-CoA biosynthesis protein BioC [Thiopseudomonas denitrificans]
MAEPCINPVARAFSAAAHSYDSEAALQREVGLRLLEQLPSMLQVDSWLDLGCGTGYFCQQLQQRFPDAQGTGLDIAPGMLQQARALRPGPDYLCADAAAVPLAAQSQDLVFSSLALQWCEDFASILAEAGRILRPGGVLAFSSLASGTLYELGLSWQAAGSTGRVNRFRTQDDYRQHCANSGLQTLQLECRPHVQHYADVRAVTRHLRGIGAQHLQQGERPGLLGRNAYQRLLHSYEQLRQPAGLPVTWQVVYGVLRKPA